MFETQYYSDIERKIKISSIVVLVVGIIISLLLAIIMFVNAGKTNQVMSYFSSNSDSAISGTLIVLGIAILIGGTIISVITSFLIYGFAVLIENTSLMRLQSNSSVNCDSVSDISLKNTTAQVNSSDSNEIHITNKDLQGNYNRTINNSKVQSKTSSDTVFCEKCGSKLRSNSKYCSVCGETVRTEDNNVLS